jgi:HEAT repeat protein
MTMFDAILPWALYKYAKSRITRRQITAVEQHDAFTLWLRQADQQIQFVIEAALQNYPDDPVGGMITLLRGTDEVIKPAVVEALVMLAQEPEYETQLSTILDALRQSVYQESPESLLHLNTGTGGVNATALRIAVAQGLGQLRDHDSIPTLVPLLSYERPAVRRATVWALSMIGGAEVLPYLAHALDDSDGDVRSSAIDALSRSNIPEALKMLEAWKQRRSASS